MDKLQFLVLILSNVQMFCDFTYTVWSHCWWPWVTFRKQIAVPFLMTWQVQMTWCHFTYCRPFQTGISWSTLNSHMGTVLQAVTINDHIACFYASAHPIYGTGVVVFGSSIRLWVRACLGIGIFWPACRRFLVELLFYYAFVCHWINVQYIQMT